MFDFNITRFLNPEFLWAAAILPVIIGFYVYRTLRGGASIQISTVSGVERSPRTARFYLRHVPLVLKFLAVALLIVAIARPQRSEYGSTTTTEGIDIVLAIDISGSMLARDFDPDRMSAAKETAARFIVDRVNDRIGLVAFAGESFTQSPLTTDKRSLQSLITQVRSGIIEDGTAIGNGIATAINRLRESDARSKVIILLTDGVNNAGQVSPLTAAEMAQTYDIRIYTIGIGTRGMAPYPTIDPWGNMSFTPVKVEIDEKMLTDIASMTGGEYFRATDNRSLADVYDRINALERTKIETNEFTRHHELYAQFALAALALLVLEFIMRRFLLRQIP